MSREASRKTIFVNDLTEGQQVNDLFLISRKTLAETKNGKPYLALSLMDRTGEIEARIWDNAPHIDAIIDTGLVVLVEAQVKAYREQLQLNIFSLSPLEDSDDILGDFVPSSRRPVREMLENLQNLINSISDQYLQKLLASIFAGDVLNKFSKAPAAKHMHHAYLGGLLEHTLSVTELAARLCQHYPSLDRDLLLAGALLHDLGKIKEFSYASVPFDYTDSGRLIGHLIIGSEMIRMHAAEINGFPPEKLDQLIHLILSHHGRHEFGAPCLPMTAEAILLHHLDDIDAKMNFIDRLSEQVEPGTYQWSDYQRTLERFLFLKGQQHSPELDRGAPVQPLASPDPEPQKPEIKDQEEPNDQTPPKTQPKLF